MFSKLYADSADAKYGLVGIHKTVKFSDLRGELLDCTSGADFTDVVICCGMTREEEVICKTSSEQKSRESLVDILVLKSKDKDKVIRRKSMQMLCSSLDRPWSHMSLEDFLAILQLGAIDGQDLQINDLVEDLVIKYLKDSKADGTEARATCPEDLKERLSYLLLERPPFIQFLQRTLQKGKQQLTAGYDKMDDV